MSYILGQKFAIDESMIATSSKWCPYRQLMKCKPIKSGIKVFVLGDSSSNFMWDFVVYTGKKFKPKVPGTPVIRDLICNKLIGPAFDFTGRIAFMDAYFTTSTILAALLARGIYAVGPTKLKQPQKKSSRKWWSWPFQEYKKNHIRYINEGKGWCRVAVQKIGVNLLMSVVWLDNKFLSINSTCFIEAPGQSHTVRRWNRASRARIEVNAPLCLQEYQKNMGAIDRIDKSNALAQIKMRRCQKRYQRTIFWWLVSTVGHHNVKVLVEAMIGSERITTIKQDRTVREMGYFHWFQYTLGEALITHGIGKAIEIASFTGTNENLHFMPKTCNIIPEHSYTYWPCYPVGSSYGTAYESASPYSAYAAAAAMCPQTPHPTTPAAPTPTTNGSINASHDLVFISDMKKAGKNIGRTWCAGCRKRSARTTTNGQSFYVIEGTNNERCPRPYTCCKQCLVVLCKDCHNNESNHSGNHRRRETRRVPTTTRRIVSPIAPIAQDLAEASE